MGIPTRHQPFGQSDMPEVWWRPAYLGTLVHRMSCSGNYPATPMWVHRCISEPAKSATLAKKSLWGFFGMYASTEQQQQLTVTGLSGRHMLFDWLPHKVNIEVAAEVKVPSDSSMLHRCSITGGQGLWWCFQIPQCPRYVKRFQCKNNDDAVTHVNFSLFNNCWAWFPTAFMLAGWTAHCVILTHHLVY